MAPKKQKRMTQRQKAERAQAKKELQAKGILPPDKPRLNRKKFAKEVWAEYEPIRREVFLLKAIGCMVGPDMLEVTPEEVGVLKLLKLAVEMDKFSQRLKGEGRDDYTWGELIEEIIMPVLKL